MSSKTFDDLFKVQNKDKNKDVELLYIATKEGGSYTLIKTNRRNTREHKIEAYVGEGQEIRKIDEKRTLIRIDTKKFDPDVSFIFYFRPAIGPGIISVKQGKRTTLGQVIRMKVSGAYEGDVEDVERAFAKALAGEEPLYYTFDMEDINYVFIFHPLRGEIKDPRVNDTKEYLKGMEFDGYMLFLQQSDKLFDAMHSISKNFFELLTTSGSLLPASPSYEILVDENLVDVIGDGDHLASGLPAEPLFLLHLGASFSSQLGIFATITRDEIDQDGTVDLSKRKKIRFSKLVAPDKDDNVTYELYAGYNPQRRKLGGMVLMNDGAEESSYLEVYEYDQDTKELKLINHYDIPMKKWYGAKKDPVDLMFNALEEIRKAKAKEGIKGAMIKAPYIDRFGDGDEESVDVIAMAYNGNSKMLVPSYMMRFKPVFEQ